MSVEVLLKYEKVIYLFFGIAQFIVPLLNFLVMYALIGMMFLEKSTLELNKYYHLSIVFDTMAMFVIILQIFIVDSICHQVLLRVPDSESIIIPLYECECSFFKFLCIQLFSFILLTLMHKLKFAKKYSEDTLT